MTLLSSVLGAASSAQSSAAGAIPRKTSPAAPREDPREKENRAAYRKILEQAAATGDLETIRQLEPKAVKAGVDTSPFMTQAQNPSVGTQIQRGIDQSLASVLGLQVPGQPSAGGDNLGSDARYNVETGQRQHPLLGPENVGSVDMAEATPPEQAPQSGELQKRLGELFTPEYTKRLLASKAGVDIGEHYGEEGQWFQQYGELRKANPNAPASKLIEMMVTKTGWAPDAVAHLKDLSPEERAIETDKVFSKLYQDPQIDSVIKKLYPNGDPEKTKAGFILDGMVQNGHMVTDTYRPFFERFLGLTDMRLADRAQEISNEVYAKGFSQEKVDAATFGGKLGRETALTQMKHDINKPRFSKGDRDKLTGAKNLINRGQSLMETIASFTGRGDSFDSNKLPTGIQETWNRYIDKYGSTNLGVFGLSPDENRIRLRTQTKEFVQFIYDMRGKQMSDTELKTGQDLIAAMDESPTQFIEKFNQFQNSVKTGIQNEIDVAKKAGYDVGDLEILQQQVNQMPDIKSYLQVPGVSPFNPQTGETITSQQQQSEQKQKTPQYKPPEGYSFSGPELTSDPKDDEKYTPGKSYQDGSSAVYMYLGGGRWRKIGQGGK